MFLRFFSVRRVVHVSSRPAQIVRPIDVYDNVVNPIENPQIVNDTQPAIWSPGIQEQFKASIYPSEESAVRYLGRRVIDQILYLSGDQPKKSILFFTREADHKQLLMELAEAYQESDFNNEVQWSVAVGEPNLSDDQIGVEIIVAVEASGSVSWPVKPGGLHSLTSGIVTLQVIMGEQKSNFSARYVTKPWMTDFATFLNTQTSGNYIIAKSNESCISNQQANQQALNNIASQLTQMLYQNGMIPRNTGINVSYSDVTGLNIITDTFVQSFEGSAGEIWRQANLIDIDDIKLSHLASKVMARHRSSSVAEAQTRSIEQRRIKTHILAGFGAILLIVLVYFWLNAATKGYYTWSLRVLAIILIIVGLMVIGTHAANF
jgi:hypothetical protein